MLSISNLFEPIYKLYCNENIGTVKIWKGYKKYISLLEQKEKIPTKIQYIDFESNQVAHTQKNNNVLVAFSGGKDSLYCVLRLAEKKYNVFLYHVRGINRSYPNEYLYAKQLANLLKLPIYIDKIKSTTCGKFNENPTKNQYIFSRMLDYGHKNNIYKYVFGNRYTMDISDAHFYYNYSDAYQMFDVFFECTKQLCGTKIEWINMVSDIVSVYKYLIQNKYKKYIPYINSCILTWRYRNYVKRNNEKKFKFILMNERCGSCKKCCYESIILYTLDYTTFPSDFITHCINILNKTAHILYRNKSKDKSNLSMFFDNDFIQTLQQKLTHTCDYE